jgi:hypothetical protein
MQTRLGHREPAAVESDAQAVARAGRMLLCPSPFV